MNYKKSHYKNINQDKGSATVILIIGIVVLALVAGAYYYFSSLSQKNLNQASTSTYVTPVTSNTADLEKDLNSISLEDDLSDFSQLDEDLKSL